MAIGRPPTCICGECTKCKHREYMRGWYQRKSPEERRAMVESRDPEKVRANDRARHQRHREARIARMKEWARRNPEKVAEANRLRIERYPEKYRANYTATNAIRDGRLIRQPCEVCGNPKADGHHDDYSKPLDVRWLCRQHHMDLHYGRREAA